MGDHDAAAHDQNLKDVEQRSADVFDYDMAIAAIDECVSKTIARAEADTS